MTNEKIKGLPVKGYTDQDPTKVALVNYNKTTEERILREMDLLQTDPSIDKRWLAIARTKLEESFMAYNRSIFQPKRVKLPEDSNG